MRFPNNHQKFIYIKTMKNAIVIGAYPNNKTTEKMLVSCIEASKAFEWDIILVSHLSLPQYIVDMVDYYIYDKKNILEPHEVTPIYWYFSNTFHLSLNGNGHIVPVCRNIINGVGIVDLLGYDYFFYMESDNILHKNDVKKIIEFEADMMYSAKQLILFDIGDKRYESLIFGGRPSFFMRHQRLPMDVTDIVRWGYPLTLEEIFYTNFNQYADELLIIQKSSYDVLSSSKINLIANHHKADIVRVENSDHYILWISNSPDNPEKISVVFKDVENVIDIVPNGYYYQQVQLDTVIDFTVFENMQPYKKKFFTTKEDLIKYDNNGYIKFI